MSKVKGTKISSKLAFVKDKFGEEALSNVIASMLVSDQEILHFLLDTGWYPIELYERVLRAICKVAAGGDMSIYSKIGEHSAEHNLNNAYRAFRSKDPIKLLENMVPMHSMLNDPGEMEVIKEQEGRCVIKVTKPRSTNIICRISRAFYQRVVELCGASNVRVLETKCSGRGDEFCQFDISWQKGEGDVRRA
jgi:predicted hydrocarbon binding protein